MLFGCDRRAELVVLAASSTTEPIERFNDDRDEVIASFGGSSTLRTQLEMGADADIFISADRRQIDRLAAELKAGEPKLLAVDRIVILVPESSEINDWRDLARAERIIIGSSEVPVGNYADRFLSQADEREVGFAANVRERIVSREVNVRLVTAKLRLGEADAVIAYASNASGELGGKDARNARKVRAVDIPAKWSRTDGVWGVRTSDGPRGQTYLRELARSNVWVESGFEAAP